MAGAAGAGWDAGAPGRCGDGAVGAAGADSADEGAAGRPITLLRGSSWREGNMKPTGCEDGWPPLAVKGDESAGRAPNSRKFEEGDGRPALLERGVAYIAAVRNARPIT